MRRFALILCIAMAAGSPVASVFAQSARWEEIKQMYYYEGDEATAIDRLEQYVANPGAGYTDAVQTEALTMLKTYFTAVSEPDRFGRILFKMFRSDNTTKITDFFSGSSLASTARSARDNWARPARARIQIGQTQLAPGAATTFSVTVLNASEQNVGTNDARIVVTPEGAATVDLAKKRLSAVREGPVSIRVIDTQGRVLGETNIVVAEGAVPTGRIEIASPNVDIGAQTQFTAKMFDPTGKEIPADGVVVRANPADMVEIDPAKGQVTARKAGVVTLSLVDKSGRTLSTGELKILPALSVSVSPAFAEIGFGASQTVTIEGNRNFTETGVTYAIEPPGNVEARETVRDATMVKLELTGRKAGTVKLRVDSKGKAGIAEASFRVLEKSQTPNLAMQEPPEKSSLLYPSIATAAALGLGVLALSANSTASDTYDEYVAGSASYDDYKSDTNKVAIYGGLAGAAAVGAGYLWYKRAQSDNVTAGISAPDSDRITVGTRGFRYLVVSVRF